jgi:uncharacterized membrane protein/Mg-chelatase subunit ChlD
MKEALDFLATHWLAALLGGVGLVLLLAGLRRRGLQAGGIALGLLALGGLALPAGPAGWLAVAAGSALFVMLFVLVLTGSWSARAASTALALALVGVGGLGLAAAGESLAGAGRALRGVELLAPWWLLLLALVPLFVLVSLPRLNRDEPRPWVALALRCLGVAALALALAEPRLRQPSEHVTVLFVVDRSQSIPEELGEDPRDPGVRVDLRAARVRDFVNNAVRQRGAGHARDQAGLIVFGRRPRLELPPSDAPRFNLKDLPGVADGTYTDIAAALKLALASFPEGSGKRVVLVSDGNENLGSAEEQARLARSLGVQIDVVPLGRRQRNEDEVLVERVEAPPVIEQGTRLPLRVLVRSFNPRVVVGRLTVKQVTEAGDRLVGGPLRVRLRLGLNPFSFTRPLTDEQRSYTYEAEFRPEWVEDDRGEKVQEGLPGDRVQNNRASAHVVARGQRRILLLEGKAGDHRFLVDRLVAAGQAKFKVHAEPVAVLDRYQDCDQLAVFLSNFDCVILANVSADQVSTERQEVLRSNTHDQGCGLVMIGGPESYGAGGWQNTAVEKALPVDADIKSLQVQGKGGLVLIMHASEMADGNLWQKRIAKLAVERLGPADEVGIIDFDFNCKWHVPLRQIAGNRAQILAQIDRMVPGDMPDFDPALQMAHGALTDPKKELATKHVIVISDGDPNCTLGLLPAMKKDRITVTTVGVATHGANEDNKMAAIARATDGRYYGPHTRPGTSDPRQLPAIYIKETRRVSQSFVLEKRFGPQVAFRSGPTDKLPDPLPPLNGFVRTTAKPSPLVEVPIRTPHLADQDFPLLAYWHYGLGKAVAFTSDAGNPRFWSRDWAAGGVFARFWEQVIDWSLRPTESRQLSMTTEYRDGKVRVTVDARTDDNRPDTGLKLRGGITAPGGRPDAAGPRRELRFVQTNSGRYEAEVRAEDAGSYFITAQAVRVRKVVGRDGKEHEVEEGVDSVRSGVTLPYSPEFADLESNTALLERLREMTGGQSYEDDEVSLAEAARSGSVFRPAPERVQGMLPMWHWLLALACGLLLCDVAVRRLAVEPAQVVAKARNLWARLRGEPVAERAAEEHTARLQSHGAQVGEGLAEERAARRFEGGPGGLAPGGADAAAAPRPPTSPPPSQPSAPQPGPEAGDYASRLLKAKKRVWEEREKGREGE